jgi:hypothetical protein
VTTIHSFSLDLVNRWRRSLGYDLPIIVDPQQGGLTERYGTHHASFAEVLTMALTLLESASVRGFISSTYPLIIVDEFQECNADAMSLICKLDEVSRVLVAADGFQDLTSADDAPCEAISYLERCKSAGATHINLSQQHRTRDNRILHTAQSLRNNIRASAPVIDRFADPKPQMLAWRVVQAVLNKQILGTCAIICPSADPQLEVLLTSIDSQLSKKGYIVGIRWTRIQTSEHERKSLCDELDVPHEPHTAEVWKLQPSSVPKLGPRAALIHSKIVRFGKLTGRPQIHSDLVTQFANAGLHADRSYSPQMGRFEVTTVHGAKNREFDHVFIFWGYRLPPAEKRRKLLYNAVTRAKRSCVLLVLQSKPGMIGADPALNLLGDYPSALKSANRAKATPPQVTRGRTEHN